MRLVRMDPNSRQTNRRSCLLPELLTRAGVPAVDGGVISEVRVTGMTDDSRAVEPGFCFVAIRGVGRDGHAFIGEAAAKGASAVIVEGRTGGLSGGTTIVRVADSRVALAKMTAAFYGLRGASPAFPMIGVTGTNGKTTVAWLIRDIVAAAGFRAGLFGTVEYDLVGERRSAPLTTPGAVELCRNLSTAREAGARYAVMEVSSHALDQRRCDGLPFAAGIFTNLTGDHLDYHGTMEAYAASKRRLFEMLPATGKAILNRDDLRSGRMAQACRCPVIWFGMDSPRLDVSARIVSMDRVGTCFELHGKTFHRKLRTRLIGRHNVMNVLAAAAATEALGISAEAICAGLEKSAGAPGRLQRVEPAGWPFSVFVDYAHTDDALANVLEAVRPLTTGRLRCVFGCGGNRDASKRPRMAATAEKLADDVYVTSDNPRTEDPQAIMEEILAGFEDRGDSSVRVELNRRKAIEMAISDAGEGDTVLIAGKGHEKYQLVGNHVLAFDDVEAARECLSLQTVGERVA